MAKKLLMLVGDYVEDYEVFVPYQMLLLVGHRVDAVCPDKKQGETILTAIHDFEGRKPTARSRGTAFACRPTSRPFAPPITTDWCSPVAEPEYLRLDGRVLDVVRHFAAANKPIAAICHGLQILTAADVVRGRSCTAYPACRPELEAAGAKWIEPSVGLDSAHVDGNLVSARPGRPIRLGCGPFFRFWEHRSDRPSRAPGRQESPALTACGPGLRQLRLGGNRK